MGYGLMGRVHSDSVGTLRDSVYLAVSPCHRVTVSYGCKLICGYYNSDLILFVSDKLYIINHILISEQNSTK
jgi:hypothetical protein